MKEYLEQNALLFPVETIVEKAGAKDFSFFLSQKNFLKVADTLEKFEENILDHSRPESKDFVLFKRQLYQMYEVQHRSREEHELYSFNLDRKNLAHSYKANLLHIENQIVQKQSQEVANLKTLNGALFKAHFLNPSRFYGLLSGAAALYAWQKFAVLAHSTSPLVMTVAIGALSLNFFKNFSQRNYVSAIKINKDGLAEMTVQDTVFKSRTVQASISNIHTIGYNSLTSSNADKKQTFIQVDEYLDEAGNKNTEPLLLVLPEDCISNREFLDWALAEQSNDSTTDGDFADLLYQRSQEPQKLGTNTQREILLGTYYGALPSDQATKQLMAQDGLEKHLREMQDHYGKDKLEAMSSKQLYQLYKSFVIGRV